MVVPGGWSRTLRRYARRRCRCERRRTCERKCLQHCSVQRGFPDSLLVLQMLSGCGDDQSIGPRRRGYPTWDDNTIHVVRTLIPANRPLFEKVGTTLMRRRSQLDWGYDSSNSHCATEVQVLKAP